MKGFVSKEMRRIPAQVMYVRVHLRTDSDHPVWKEAVHTIEKGQHLIPFVYANERNVLLNIIRHPLRTSDHSLFTDHAAIFKGFYLIAKVRDERRVCNP